MHLRYEDDFLGDGRISREKLVQALQRAEHARSVAYAPYSHFHVGAALVLDDGEIVEGCNVENASYGLSICAERTAATRAVASGRRTFIAVAIAGPREAHTAPCGACRQFLSEFDPDMVVAFTTPEGATVTTLNRLLPHSFGPKSLV